MNKYKNGVKCESLTKGKRRKEKMHVEVNEIVEVKSKGYMRFKRICDLVVTIVAAPITISLVVIFAVVVKIDSKGPAFYTQIRIGKNGREFKIYKLRSMKTDAELTTGSVWAEKDDPRITSVGHFIRKVRIENYRNSLMSYLGI